MVEYRRSEEARTELKVGTDAWSLAVHLATIESVGEVETDHSQHRCQNAESDTNGLS